MPSITTTYLGIPLSSPLVVAASSLSNLTDTIAQAEEAGAGALVIRSLFEEQMELDSERMDRDLAVGSESFPEALDYFPSIDFGDASEHLMWVEKSRERVEMPLIASLNARSKGSWVHYANLLEQTGVDGLELNVYAVEADAGRSAADVEEELYDLVHAVCDRVSIPVSVKLSPFYTSLAQVTANLERTGIKGLVLFNRFLQPDIDVDSETLLSEIRPSTPAELALPLRWIGLLYGRQQLDLALSTGAHSGEDAAKAILAGASVVQIATALLRNGVPYLSLMLRQLENWMEEHGHGSLEDFRGKLSLQHVADPSALERAHYVNLLSKRGRKLN
ncbi:MAG: dihydroorotate dehydrogenase-like protein [Verrucomicrobiota bacterium]